MSSFKSDYAFGIAKEDEVITMLNKAFNTEFCKESQYSSIDFKSDALDAELKSSNNAHDANKNTMVPKSKIDFIKHQLNVKPKRFIFAFNFTDGLYYIEYNAELFDTFECKNFVRNQRVDYMDKPQLYYFIPIDKLKLIASSPCMIARDA